MSHLRMLIEFLKLSSEEGADGEFFYEEEEQERPLLEEPLKFLAGLFGKKVAKKKPDAPKPVASEPPVVKGDKPVSNKPSAVDLLPPMVKKVVPKEKWISSGCVVFDSIKDMSRVYVIQQKNWNTWAFPKGRVDSGESVKKAAVREVAEETGLQVSLLPSGYLGKGIGSYSITHFFAAVKTGGSPGQHDQEVSKVKLVTFTEAFKLFKKSGGKAGKRDLMMLRKAWEYANKYRKGKVPEWPGK